MTLYIILAWLGIAAVAFLVMVIVTFFELNNKLAKGEITPEELEKLRLKRVKKAKPKRIWIPDTSFPKPLRHMLGRWI